MVSTSSPPFPPSSAGVEYSKIGSTSSSALQYSSYKVDAGNKDLQHKKLRAFCVGYGGRALACAVAALGICILVIFLVQGRQRHNGAGDLHNPGPSVSPLTAPVPFFIPPAPSPVGTPPSSPPTALSNALSLSSLCNTTEQPDLCLTTLSTYPSKEQTVVLQDLTAFVTERALTLVNQTDRLAASLVKAGNGSRSVRAALQDCLDLLDQAVDGLNASIEGLTHFDLHTDEKGVKVQVMNVRVSLSSSYTQQDTCWDGLQSATGPIKDQMLESGQPIAPLIAMALSFAQTLEDAGFSSYYALHLSPP